MIDKAFDRLPKIVGILAVLVNLLFLSYLVIFACARQSAPLFAAVGIDLFIFVTLGVYRGWRGRTQSYRREQASLSHIEQSLRWVYLARRTMALASATMLLAVSLYMSADLAALGCAINRNYLLSQTFYSLIAPPIQLNLHPAFSLELLAGAYIEAGHFDKAEPLQYTILHVCKNACGAESQEMAAMYANLGDFYKRCHRRSRAEVLYRKAIALAQKLELPQGWGSPMTKLACMLRDEGHYAEAKECFEEAIAIRSKLFGMSSVKVAQTKLEYARLLQLEKQTTLARQVRTESLAIISKQRQQVDRHNSTDRLCLAIPLLACLISFFRGRILAWFASRLPAKADARKPKRHLERVGSYSPH